MLEKDISIQLGRLSNCSWMKDGLLGLLPDHWLFSPRICSLPLNRYALASRAIEGVYDQHVQHSDSPALATNTIALSVHINPHSNINICTNLSPLHRYDVSLGNVQPVRSCLLLSTMLTDEVTMLPASPHVPRPLTNACRLSLETMSTNISGTCTAIQQPAYSSHPV
jgi:hypothetical protein